MIQRNSHPYLSIEKLSNFLQIIYRVYFCFASRKVDNPTCIIHCAGSLVTVAVPTVTRSLNYAKKKSGRSWTNISSFLFSFCSSKLAQDAFLMVNLYCTWGCHENFFFLTRWFNAGSLEVSRGKLTRHRKWTLRESYISKRHKACWSFNEILVRLSRELKSF
jgi:hypothetical protein